MPLIDFRPNDSITEVRLARIMDLLRKQIKGVVTEISGFPESDVIINLHRCDVRDADPCTSAFVVYIETNPNEELECAANTLRDRIAQVLIGLGLTENQSVEIWPRFINGPWCLIRDNEIVESVDYS